MYTQRQTHTHTITTELRRLKISSVKTDCRDWTGSGLCTLVCTHVSTAESIISTTRDSYLEIIDFGLLEWKSVKTKFNQKIQYMWSLPSNFPGKAVHLTLFKFSHLISLQTYRRWNGGAIFFLVCVKLSYLALPPQNCRWFSKNVSHLDLMALLIIT